VPPPSRPIPPPPSSRPISAFGASSRTISPPPSAGSTGRWRGIRATAGPGSAGWR
jgi:hypothetical protein